MKQFSSCFVLFVVFVLLAITSPVQAAAPLKIGTLLIEDVVPLYLAEEQGLYRQEGLAVELIPFLSALERDSALTAGAIDGAIDDPVGAILLDQGRGLIQITSLCLGATAAEGTFAILAAPKSGLKRVEELKEVAIGVSNSTIIEYVTDRMLTAQGFTPAEIHKIEVKKMPIRMQMLLANAIQAATLPEPLASIAASKGAVRLLSDGQSSESLSQTVMVFRKEVLAQRSEDVARFFRAYTRAVELINSNPEQYRPLFVEKGRIPPQLAPDYPIPHYPRPAPFPRELYTPVMEWLVGKGLVRPLAYEQLVAIDLYH
ncbi:MetQ/NlpA family ABC transporter substrate-binding protein [Desulfogranum mediterraneum]|uniref:MetQ/NlpA family ABC transporter substrate-binding protein n=1 Tax=Desulfogranum mediterraneum TaxID=160661 RepID=UPI00040A6A9A|nr:MetQ/NlpA family ABC transporter substrate-binding protein [Desulfogranum mediterraneum]